MSDIMTKLEERIYHKFNFFFLKRNCEKFFDQLVEIPIEERFKEGKVLKIHKNSKPVSYDELNKMIKEGKLVISDTLI